MHSEGDYQLKIKKQIGYSLRSLYVNTKYKQCDFEIKY